MTPAERHAARQCDAFNPGPYAYTRTGRKWSARARERYFSGGFDFYTFADAVAWCRQIKAMAIKHPYEGGYVEFECSVTGPGGEMDVYSLVPRPNR